MADEDLHLPAALQFEIRRGKKLRYHKGILFLTLLRYTARHGFGYNCGAPYRCHRRFHLMVAFATAFPTVRVILSGTTGMERRMLSQVIMAVTTDSTEDAGKRLTPSKLPWAIRLLTARIKLTLMSLRKELWKQRIQYITEVMIADNWGCERSLHWIQE